ncbi:MAG: hypothetical protein RHS_4371 [Robinsoniella sp. RHS]|nr:MAG: hypothetical protein RHS_4371 [Robinsoniella sp. RHS]
MSLPLWMDTILTSEWRIYWEWIKTQGQGCAMENGNLQPRKFPG